MKQFFTLSIFLFFCGGVWGQAITVLPPDGTAICPGGSVVLTVTPAPLPTTTFEWRRISATGTLLATSPTYTTSTSGRYKVILIRGSVRDTTIPAIVLTDTTNPVASFTSAPATINCSNIPISFSNTSGTGLTFDWNFGDFNAGTNNTSTSTNPTHTFIGTTGNGNQSFTVNLIAKNSFGCTGTVSHPVTTRRLPDAKLDGPNATTYNGLSYFRQCDSGSAARFDFTNLSTSVNDSYKILWGDGRPDTTFTSFAGIISHTYGIGSNTLSFIVNGNGCSDTTVYYVYVGSNPGVGLNIPPDSARICSGKAITFPISGTSLNTPGTIYVFTVSDGSAPISFNQPPPASITHVFNIGSCNKVTQTSPVYINAFSATIEAFNPCSTVGVSSTVVPIYVSTKPSADFAISPNDTVCLNSTTTLTNTTLSNGYINAPNCIQGKFVWSVTPSTGWTLTSGNLGSDNGTTNPSTWSGLATVNVDLNFTTAGTYTTQLKVGNPSCGLDSLKKIICVNPKPIADFNVNQTLCTGLTDTITNIPTVFTCGTGTYQWDISYTGNPACLPNTSSYTYVDGTDSLSANPHIRFNNPGVYRLLQTAYSPGRSCYDTTAKIITVKSPPTISLNLNLPANSCGTLNIAPTANVVNCGTLAPSYAWLFSGGSIAGASTLSPGNIIFSTVGVHPIKFTATNECGSAAAFDTVTVGIAPNVIVPSDDTVCSGALAGAYNFSSTVGTPAYNWRNDNASIGLSLTGTGNIAPFTAINTSTVPVIATIIVTPSTGTCTGQADTFKITIAPGPAPPGVLSPVSYCQNATAATLTATGANPLTWYNNAGLTGGTATAPTPVTTIAGSVSYYVTQTNTYGCRSDSSVIEVLVAQKFTGNLITAPQTICLGNVPNPLTGTTFSGGSGFVSSQWQSSPDGITAWGNVGTNNSIYTPVAITDTTFYRRILFNSPPSSSCPDTSNVITIFVLSPLTNNAIDISQTICEGSIPALLTGQLPSGGGGAYTYKWQSSLDNFSTILVDGIPGATGLNYQPPALSVTTYYRRVVITSLCGEVNSNIIKITVNPTPAGAILVNNSPICTNEIAGVSFTATVGTAPYTVSLEITKPAGIRDTIVQIISGNGPANIQVLPGNNAPGIYSVSIIKLKDANGCERLNITPSASIAVLTNITNKIKKDTTICNGQSVTILTDSLFGGSATGIPAAYTYQWQSTPQGQNNWQDIAGANAQTFLASPTSSTCYRRNVQTNNRCQVSSNSVCVTVDPGISNNQIDSSQQVCVNIQATNLIGALPLGGNGTYGYTWLTSVDLITWNIVAATISYQPPVYAAAGVHYFRRDVTSGNCTSESNIITITVRPDSRAEFTARKTDSCAAFDLSTVITVNALPDSNGTYNWYADDVPFLSNPNTTGIFPGYIINNPGDTVLITLITISQYGCKRDTAEQQFTTIKTVSPFFVKDSVGRCGPHTVTFDNQTVYDTGAATFLWDFGNGQTSTLEEPGSITYVSSPNFRDTTYTVTLKAINICDTTKFTTGVFVRANPKAKFGVDTTFICSNALVTITNNSLGRPDSCLWDFGDGQTLTTFTNGTFTHRYNVGNSLITYTIRLIAINECKRDTQFIPIRVAPINIVPAINVINQVGCIDQGGTGHTVSFINNSTGAITYTWNFGDNTIPLVTSNSDNIVPHTYDTAGYFIVSTKMENGCPTDTTVRTWVRIFNKPKANFTLNRNQFCAGDTVKVLANTSTNGLRYSWNWGDGTGSIGGFTPPPHVYDTGGTYTIILTALVDTLNVIACTDIHTITITVLNKPDVRVVSNIVQCTRDTVRVSAPYILPNETAQWTFFDNAGSVIIPGTSAQYVYNQPGNYSVKLVATNALGCSDSTIINFVIKAKPFASFLPGNLQVCTTDTTIIFTNTTPTVSGQLLYQWLVNTNVLSTTPGFTHRYQAPVGIVLPYIFTTQLVVTNSAAGCSDTATATLQMNPKAIPQFSIANPADCIPFVATINNTSQYTTSYQWLLNGVLVDNTANPAILITQPATQYTIRLIADNVYGCGSVTKDLVFTSRAMPDARFTLSDTLSCTGSLSTSTINTSINAPNSIWDWGDATPRSSLRNTSHLYNSIGQYQVTLIVGDATCADTASRYVRIDNKPVADFSANTTVSCDTAKVLFTNLSSGATSYLWYFGDGTTSNATDPIKNFPPSVNPYTIKLVAIGNLGCSDSIIKPNYILAQQLPPGDFTVLPRDRITIPDYTFTFNNLTPNSSNYTYQWDLGDFNFASTRDVTHKYLDTGYYNVKLFVLDSRTNCIDSTIKVVRIDGYPGYLYVPNAFYPNSIRSEFQTFKPLGKGLETYTLQVFDGWGKLLFQTSKLNPDGSPQEAWDGRYKGVLMQQDAYVWKISAKFRSGKMWDGMSYNGKKPETFGSLTLFY